jgi:propanol-preferring alcohol dehydrogenase
VRVRVHVCAACRTDLHVVEGELPVRRAGVTPGHQVVGTVEKLGPGVEPTLLGQRVGIAWLHATCGQCVFCLSGRENLCEQAAFTGYTEQGGFAERMLARADFLYPLQQALEDERVAPLLCAGIIGYRCLQRTGIASWPGARLGIYGFGAAGHIAIQIARARGAEVYVATREAIHRQLAAELGASWVGGTFDAPPVRLDASIVFAPAGELVPVALAQLEKGGTLVLGGIHMSDIPSLPYPLLYGERAICSVANNTREDGRAFLAEAARIGVHTHVQTYAFEQLTQALIDLKRGVAGAAVVRVA